jgi:hypothetical protein
MTNLITGENSRIFARPDRRAYGMGLGVILLDDVYPGFPGDVRNASAWPYPLQYDVAEGVDIFRLVDPDHPDRDSCFDAILASAKRLERLGCRAIVAECGFFCYFQKRIADALSIPVFMSSLLQVSWAQQFIARSRSVAVLTGFPQSLTPQHLEAVGIAPDERLKLFSTYDLCGSTEPEFKKLWSTRGLRTNPPSADFNLARTQIVTAAKAVVDAHPEVGAIVLECTGYPPFASAIQAAVDLPIFSWGTLMDFAYGVSVHRQYAGHV